MIQPFPGQPPQPPGGEETHWSFLDSGGFGKMGSQPKPLAPTLNSLISSTKERAVEPLF